VSQRAPEEGLPAPAEERQGNAGPAARSFRVANLPGRVAVIGGYLLMLVVFAVLQPDVFLQAATARNILDQAVVPTVLVCGLTFVLVTGEFDLSYTSTLGLSGGITVVLITQGWSVPTAITAALLCGLIVGLLVGLLVTLGRASSFIVTLAIGSAVTGIEQALTDNTSIFEGIPQSFNLLTLHEFLGLKAAVWFALLVLFAAAILLHATKFGRHAQAIGANSTAAYLAGVKVRQTKIAVFALLAVLTVCAAVILTSRSASYYPNLSSGLLLNTYAAAFLGAAVGSRSQFTVVGSAFGVLWITTLQAGLTINNQPAWTSNLIQGIVLAVAVLIAAGGRRRAA
jgi:ribose transport system permease protein